MVEQDPDQVPIDQASYLAFVTKDPVSEALDERIAAGKLFFIEDPLPVEPPHVVERLRFLGITTIGNLRAAVEREAEDAAALADRILDRPEFATRLPRGIGVYYVGFVMAGKSLSVDDVLALQEATYPSEGDFNRAFGHRRQARDIVDALTAMREE